MKKVKRLFLDIETSPNMVFSWNVGYKLNIGHDNILKEREIICICYKWEGKSKVHSLEWNKGDDKEMVLKFIEILKQADELVGHNGDNYDLKFLRGRAIYHGIKNLPKFVTTDTLKIARTQFRLNSNRLDYIGKYLGFGGKIETGGFGLWKDIVLKNSKEAMNKMVKYCKRDVVLLEKVYNALQGYVPSKIHAGVLAGKSKCSCPNCSSTKTAINQRRITVTGIKGVTLRCGDCGKYFSMSETALNKARGL
jgi:DNA polymerase elongation subunit (family B)